MTSRDAILGRIRSAVSGDTPLERPAIPEVWPRENPSVDDMAERFCREVQALGGEPLRIASMDDAASKLSELAEGAGWQSIGAIDRPLCRELAAKISDDRMLWSGDADPKAMAVQDVGLVEADYLLADTGSAMIACGEPRERLLCYLPPVSIVVATNDRLIEHMPAIWDKVADRCADPELRGEFVFITGPSRTADIEKILILGVHGPKRLIVMLVDA